MAKKNSEKSFKYLQSLKIFCKNGGNSVDKAKRLCYDKAIQIIWATKGCTPLFRCEDNGTNALYAKRRK